MATACVPVTGAVGPGDATDSSRDVAVVSETDDRNDGLGNVSAEEIELLSETEGDERYLDAYFEYYDYDHAVYLAEYWGYDSVYDAKITKGKFMLDEIEFPPGVDDENYGETYVDAYFEASYDYDYAVELAEYWGYENAYDAKVIKGKVLLGETEFPPAAGEEPDSSPEQAFINAYFEAGYDYDYAVELAEYWGYENAYEAKITKGKVLVEGIAFPPAANPENVDDGRVPNDEEIDDGHLPNEEIDDGHLPNDEAADVTCEGSTDPDCDI